MKGSAEGRRSCQVFYTEFNKPDGWIIIPLRPMEADGTGEGPPIPAHHLRIIIVANHSNGKDTHVRGLKVFGPPEYVSLPFHLS